MRWNAPPLTLPMPCRHLRFTFVSHEMNGKSHGWVPDRRSQTRAANLNHSAGTAGSTPMFLLETQPLNDLRTICLIIKA
jgi:hypothetical protein